MSMTPAIALPLPSPTSRLAALEIEVLLLCSQKEVLAEQHQRDLREIAGLRAENARLNVRVADLERRLGKDSTNSSKPPSGDFQAKPDAEAKVGKPRGGRPGHRGKTRKGYREPDRVEDLVPERCDRCGHSLAELPLAPGHRHQVAEWAAKPVEVVEYHHQVRCCPGCQAKVEALYPADVIPGSTLGPKVIASIALFNRWGHMPIEKLAAILAGEFGLTVVAATLSNSIRRVKEALEVPYAGLARRIPLEPRLNIDDTGWRTQGVRGHVWAFTTPKVTFLKITKTKSGAVLDEVIGPDYAGVVIADFYNVFDRYLTQRCLAHLSRELKACLDDKDPLTRVFGFEALAMVHEAWALWRDYQRDELHFTNTRHHVEAIKDEFAAFLAGLPEKVPEPVRLLRQRFRDYWTEIWYFLDHPEVMPHNNDAERGLRPVVTYRKVAGGSNSHWGAEATAMILSVTDTCRKQGRDPHTFIVQALLARAHPSRVPYPSFFDDAAAGATPTGPPAHAHGESR